MGSYRDLTLIGATYMLTALLALHTASVILPLMYPPEGGEQIISPIVSEPENVSSSLWIFAYVLVGTFVLLFLLKRGWDIVVRFALLVSFFTGSSLTFLSLFGDPGIFLTFALIAFAIFKRDDPFVANFLLLFTIPGIGALLGISLGFTPWLLLLLLMSAYDAVAVFVTKHMVELAQKTSGRFAFMFTFPAGDRLLGLGAGDIAFPSAFVCAVLASDGIGYAIPTAFGGLLGIVFLYYYMVDRKGVTLPALPPITAGLLLGYLFTNLIL